MKTHYAGRQPGIVPKTLNLDRRAAEALEAMACHWRAQGQFLSALILAEAARRETRDRREQRVDDAHGQP